MTKGRKEPKAVNKTMRGMGGDFDEAPTVVEPIPAGAAMTHSPAASAKNEPKGAQATRRKKKVARGSGPLVEIEVVHEHGPAPSGHRHWRTVEVWTRNRLYTLNSRLTCIEVTDLASRETVGDHPFLGMRLVGGQHREGGSMELSYPFPRPGTEGVFEQPDEGRRGGFSRTSTVKRVVLRLNIITVAPSHVVPTWEEITGLFEVPEGTAD